MKIELHTSLPVSAETAWQTLTSPAFLGAISEPLIKMRLEDGGDLPKQLQCGEELRVNLSLGSFIPLGSHIIRCVRFDEKRRIIYTDESNLLVKHWHHRIEIKPRGRSRCEAIDQLDIHAGIFTLHVWSFANILYRYRQQRLRALIKAKSR